MSAHDLQSIIDQAAGKRIDLEPTDSFDLGTGKIKIRGQIDLHGNGAEVLRKTPAGKTRWGPMFSGPNVTGVIEGLNLYGGKNPDVGYQAAKEDQAAFWFMGAKWLDLFDCTISNFPGDALYLGAIPHGSKRKSTRWFDACHSVLVDLDAYDLGRHAVAAVGVETVGDLPGLTILADSSFALWRRSRIDLEAMNGFKTKRTAVVDLGATWRKKP